jgi:hypothetical protein
LTGAEVIDALKVRDFSSEHIQTLEATSIPFPGYNAYTENDEIHCDHAEQHIFPKPGEDEGGERAAQSAAAHQALREYVEGQQLWYVLLHGPPKEVIDGHEIYGAVVLFAVGRSPTGNRLVGVVTNQMCHNLCD